MRIAGLLGAVAFSCVGWMLTWEGVQQAAMLIRHVTDVLP